MSPLFNYLSLNSHLHVSFTQSQTRTANSLRVGKVGVQWLEYLYINITDVCLYIKFCSLHWARCLQCHRRAIKNMWQEATKPRKRKQQVCTPAQGSRDATITIQGQVFNVRVPIISFQYAALSRVRVSICVCALPSLFHNPARSIFQSGSHSVAGVEERKLADRLRYNPIHYSAAVRDRITILHLERPADAFRSLLLLTVITKNQRRLAHWQEGEWFDVKQTFWLSVSCALLAELTPQKMLLTGTSRERRWGGLLGWCYAGPVPSSYWGRTPGDASSPRCWPQRLKEKDITAECTLHHEQLP